MQLFASQNKDVGLLVAYHHLGPLAGFALNAAPIYSLNSIKAVITT